MFIQEGGYSFGDISKIAVTATASSTAMNNATLLLTNVGDATIYLSNKTFTDVELGYPLKSEESIQSVKFQDMFYMCDGGTSTLQVIKMEAL